MLQRSPTPSVARLLAAAVVALAAQSPLRAADAPSLLLLRFVARTIG